MYAAKRQLSGALQYDAAFDSFSAQTLSLLTELRHAVEHHELRLYLQPKVPLHGQPGLAAEALVRCQHPQRGLVPPMQFIPFAEQTGFVRQLTLWMFEEVARLLADPRTRGLPLRVSVNLSTRDLLDPELSHRLADILVRHGVAASAFCLEITESAIMDDPQRAEAMLNRLSEHGFKLSIDDFGTGYSSLAYLKRLPVDELKIDKSFVMGMETGEDDAMIVRSTIDLAHNRGSRWWLKAWRPPPSRIACVRWPATRRRGTTLHGPCRWMIFWPGRPARGSWRQAVASQFWVRAVRRRKYPQCLPPPLAHLRALPPLQPPTLAAHRLLRQPPVGPRCAARP